MPKALYVDIDVDLFVSTAQALRWLVVRKLLRPGSLVSYDDWYEVPFLRGGESKAHFDIAFEQKVEFELVPHAAMRLGAGRRKGRQCKPLFRVRSIGIRADPGVGREFARASCRAWPNIVSAAFRLNHNRQTLQECVALYESYTRRVIEADDGWARFGR